MARESKWPRDTQFMTRLDKYIEADELEAITTALKRMGFFTAPASTKYHSAYEGGLYDHSECVAFELAHLTEANDLVWSRPESPWIIGMFHDLCKCDQYIQTSPDVYEYNPNTLYKGHGDKSVMLASTLMRLTPEEVACIRYHMGAFVPKEEWGDYTRAIHQFPNVLWTHMADMIASHIIEERE